MERGVLDMYCSNPSTAERDDEIKEAPRFQRRGWKTVSPFARAHMIVLDVSGEFEAKESRMLF